MSQTQTCVHLLAGGLGGTAGAIASCPLEVVKTRLQSSVSTFGTLHHTPLPSPYATAVSAVHRLDFCHCSTYGTSSYHSISPVLTAQASRTYSLGIWRCLNHWYFRAKISWHIVEHEGTKALFKGLVPNLVGVAPSRAVYFCSYSRTKEFCNQHLTPDTPLVHIFSAASAGFMSCTLTNPIWFVKTRLQLDQRMFGSVSSMQCIKDIYTSNGIVGFYKGITASYFGISETIIHFVIYEFIKAKLRERRSQNMPQRRSSKDFLDFMVAGAISKTCASCLAYPHEVARTRLRQEGDKYKSFFQTLLLVFKEEGWTGLYRGLGTQLVRQIPNTAIMMATYEAVVYLFSNYPCAVPVPVIQICNEEESY